MRKIFVEHKGLGKSKVVSGKGFWAAVVNADAQKRQWDAEYERKLEKERIAEQKKEERERVALMKHEQRNLEEQHKQRAATMTAVCEEWATKIANCLKNSLASDYTLYEQQGDFKPYTHPVHTLELIEKPEEPEPLLFENYRGIAKSSLMVLFFILSFPFVGVAAMIVIQLISRIVFRESQNELAVVFGIIWFVLTIYLTYRVSGGLTKKIITNLIIKPKERKLWDEWVNSAKEIDAENKKIQEENSKRLEQWRIDRDAYINEQQDMRDKLSAVIKGYGEGNPDDIASYVSLLLNKLERWDVDFDALICESGLRIVGGGKYSLADIEYNIESKTLIIKPFLPAFADIQKLPKKILYKNGEYETKYYTENEIKKMFNSLISQIIISIVHAVFTGDKMRYIETVVINGPIDTIDAAVGTRRIDVFSVNRQQFEELDLSKVDAYQCFKKLTNISLKEQQKNALAQKHRGYYEMVNSIIDCANTGRDSLVIKHGQENLDELISELFDKTVNSIKKIKAIDSEEWVMIGDFIAHIQNQMHQILKRNQEVLEYYDSPAFLKIKETCDALMSSQREFNEYITEKARSISHLFGTSVVREETLNEDEYNYIRPYKKTITPFTAEVSQQVFSSAENNPLKYVIKQFYTDKASRLEQIQKLYHLVEELETLQDARQIIDNYKKEYHQYLVDVPDFVMQHDEAGFYSRLGFANIDESVLTIQYKFSYTSGGGMAQRSFVVPMTEETIVELIRALESELSAKAFAKEQRNLMTRKLREYIKTRDNFTCCTCGNSTHVEPNLLLEIDHIIPVAKGGYTLEDNLQTLCWKCNRAKSDKILA